MIENEKLNSNEEVLAKIYKNDSIAVGDILGPTVAQNHLHKFIGEGYLDRLTIDPPDKLLQKLQNIERQALLANRVAFGTDINPILQLANATAAIQSSLTGSAIGLHDTVREHVSRLSADFLDKISPFVRPIGVFEKLVNEISELEKISALSSHTIPGIEDLVKGIDTSSGNLVIEGLEKFDDDYAFLEEQGYNFVGMWLEYPEINGISTKPKAQRGAILTRTLLKLTNRSDFQNELLSYFETNNMLKKRKKIIEQSYQAHKQKLYHLSVLGFMSQIDGIWTDALVKYKILVRKRINGKVGLYLRDTVETQKKEKQVTFSRKVELKPFTPTNHEDVLQPLHGKIKESVTSRNSMMHGDSVQHGTAKMSILSLLMIHILSIEIDTYEKEILRSTGEKRKS